MKQALVIHPLLSFYAGGEFLCLNVCKALQDMGYEVVLASDVYDPLEFDRIYGMGQVMKKCKHVPIPVFRPRFPYFKGFQRLFYARRVLSLFKNFDADIVFSTQSSPFVIPRRIFHFVYSVNDIFNHPSALAPPKLGDSHNILRRVYIAFMLALKNRIWRPRAKSQDWFFTIGTRVLNDLRRIGFTNSSLAYPPCRVDFKPKFPKKNHVVQAARLVPDKKLESYFEIASRLPEFKFFLIGTDSPLLRGLHPGYSDLLLSKLPENVTYMQSSVRDLHDLIEECKIYVYTGIERGIVLSIVEAMAAGCIPVSRSGVGAMDILDASGLPLSYETVEQAAAIIRSNLLKEIDQSYFLEIAAKAQRFSPKTFQDWVKEIVQNRNRITEAA